MKKQLLLVMILLAFGAIGNQAQTSALKEQIVDKIGMPGLSKTEIKECGGVNKIVYALKNVDLNKDGKPEFIAYFLCSPHFGFFVLRKTDNDIEVIFEGAERQDISALKTPTKGWLNLRLSSYSAGTGGSGAETLRWNRLCYQNAWNPC